MTKQDKTKQNKPVTNLYVYVHYISTQRESNVYDFIHVHCQISIVILQGAEPKHKLEQSEVQLEYLCGCSPLNRSQSDFTQLS